MIVKVWTHNDGESYVTFALLDPPAHYEELIAEIQEIDE